MHELLRSELDDLAAVVVVDDLQKGCPEVLDGIRALADAALNVNGIRLVVLSREKKKLSNPDAVSRGLLRELTLGGLDADSAARLMGANVPAGERSRLLAATNGHPLYIELLSRRGASAGKEAIEEHLGKEIYAARKGARTNNLQSVHFVRADCRFMPLRSASSQLVFCASVLEHLPDVLPAVLEIARILDSSGKLVVGAPTENALYGMGRRLVGLRKPVDHFHQGVRLEAVIDRKFTRSLSRKLPFSFLPTFLALYLISVYEKSREPIACASDTTPAPHCMPHLSSSPASY